MKLLLVIVVSLSLSGLALGQEKCENKNRLCIPKSVQTWQGAVDFCKKNGWKLAVVNSEAKQMKIESMGKKLDEFKRGKVELWIGANDQAKEGRFVWEANKKPLEYANWMPGNPDNKGGKENCVHIWYEKAKNYNWVWNDVVCSSKRRFVCQSKKQT